MQESWMDLNMQRQTFITALTVQFDNPVTALQYGAPALLTSVSVVLGVDEKPVYSPAYTVVPAAATDITEEMLAVLSAKLATLGLKVSRNE